MDPNPIYPFENKYFVGRSWMVLDGVLAERVSADRLFACVAYSAVSSVKPKDNAGCLSFTVRHCFFAFRYIPC